jgi:uncharacterized protein (DUF2235 family)
MSKNIVLCCDGTANEFARDKTNVVKLFYTLTNDPARQVTYYHPGLGTMEPAGALTTVARAVTKLLGRAIGYGLASDIRDAYVFLMNTFEPGDRVFLFGFSRGAYTVRSLASVIHMYGLIRPGNDPLVPYAIRMLAAINDRPPAPGGGADSGNAAPDADPGGIFGLARDFCATFSSTECKPWFVGIWDTVSSVGWIHHPLKLPFTADNPDIEIGRHAVSIDERRAFFRTNLWMPKAPPAQSGPKDLKQVWFPGVHCDVGGGYPESESGLSKIALEWMLCEARTKGLLLDEDRVALVLGKRGRGYVAPDAAAMMHESLKGAWRLAEFVPKRHYDWTTHRWRHRMNLFRRRTIPAKSLVHESAFERGEDYRKRLPADAIRVATDTAPGTA